MDVNIQLICQYLPAEENPCKNSEFIVIHHANKLYIYTRIIKNIFNKNERRCRDVKTQKACEQGWEANIGPKN